VFYFELRPCGEFKSPSEYERQAIAVASTHDLPTLAGWWEGRDIALRDALGLYPSEDERDRQMRGRADDRARLLSALERTKIKPAGIDSNPASTPAMTAELARAIHLYLAMTPAALVVAQLEDIAGMRDQANLPGTTSEHPNWCRELSVSLEELRGDARFIDLARALRRERPPRRVD